MKCHQILIPGPYRGAKEGIWSHFMDFLLFVKKISSSKCRGPKYFLRKPNHIVEIARFYGQNDGYGPGPRRPSFRFLSHF